MKRSMSCLLSILLVLLVFYPLPARAQTITPSDTLEVVSTTNYSIDLSSQAAYQNALMGINELSDKAKEMQIAITPTAHVADASTQTLHTLPAFSSTQLLSKVEYADRSVTETYVTTAATRYSDTNSTYAGANVTIYARVYWTLHYDDIGIPMINCTYSEHWVVQPVSAVTTMSLSNFVCTTFPATYENSKRVHTPISGTHNSLNSPYTADIAYLTEEDAHFRATTEAYIDGNYVSVDVNHKF